MLACLCVGAEHRRWGKADLGRCPGVCWKELQGWGYCWCGNPDRCMHGGSRHQHVRHVQPQSAAHLPAQTGWLKIWWVSFLWQLQRNQNLRDCQVKILFQAKYQWPTRDTRSFTCFETAMFIAIDTTILTASFPLFWPSNDSVDPEAHQGIMCIFCKTDRLTLLAGRMDREGVLIVNHALNLA